VRSALAIALLTGLAACAVPLFGVQGPQSALLTSLVLSPAAAGLCASLGSWLRSRGGLTRASQLVQLAVVIALGLVALPAVVLWLDALRIRNCTPLEGFLHMLLGPGCSVPLAALCGFASAVLVTPRHAAIGCAVALPLGSVVLALARFYFTPGIFAYGHFFGMFPGTLYDEDVQITEALASLRVATSAWSASLGLFLVSCVDPSTLCVSRARMREHHAALVLALALAVSGGLAEVFSTELHHTTSHAAIRAMLGGHQQSRRCDLYFPQELSREERARLADECDFGMHRAEDFLGVRHVGRAHVYVFRSSDDKRLWMGAGGTNLAKPWRSEVYLSESSYPNPTLGHELAHVVAGVVGAGPLRVSGKLGGLWPDLALVEGVAVAAAWGPADGLTPHEWAQALRRLERLAYTLSGSLLRFVAERHGAAVLRKVYARGDLPGALGISVEALEREWLEFLAGVPVSQRSLELARARFEGASIFSATCPHEQARLERGLRAELGAGDDRAARKSCELLLDIDPAAHGARAVLVGVLARLHDDPEAERLLQELQRSGSGHNPYLAAARQALADEAARRGDHARARSLYETLAAQPIDDDSLRQLQVKALAQRSGAREARILFELLVGEPGQRADPATAVHLARELRSERSDGLPHYLEARQLFFQKRYAHAAHLLGHARTLGLPSPELRAEALRVEGVARYAIGELDVAAARFREYAASGGAGRAADANDWLARIAWRRQ
jgi:hypothetical protein